MVKVLVDPSGVEWEVDVEETIDRFWYGIGFSDVGGKLLSTGFFPTAEEAQFEIERMVLGDTPPTTQLAGDFDELDLGGNVAW